ncbi:MAG: FeoB-associated Cys-rich membrane protein [Oscillospiraceae bacterium]|nr:FeoB-associated Cys-rich membrane protein [Oscillospiraceae bacterium]
MNLASFLILAVLALVVVFALKGAKKSRAKGCGCGCSSCPHPCGKAVDKAPEKDYNKNN